MYNTQFYYNLIHVIHIKRHVKLVLELYISSICIQQKYEVPNTGTFNYSEMDLRNSFINILFLHEFSFTFLAEERIFWRSSVESKQKLSLNYTYVYISCKEIEHYIFMKNCEPFCANSFLLKLLNTLLNYKYLQNTYK